MQGYLRYFLLMACLISLAGCSDKSSKIENPHKDFGSEKKISVSKETLFLFGLVDQDNLKQLKEKLSQGIKPEVQNAQGDTLLIYAASKAKIKIVKLLLDAGATVNAYGGQGDTALLRAAAEGYTEVVKTLIDAGAGVNVRGKKYYFGATSLFLASSIGSIKTVELLLKSGADLDLANNGGVTPLMDAAHGSQGMVKLLLKHGAKISLRDNSGNNAMKIARREGQKEIYKILRQVRKDRLDKDKMSNEKLEKK